MKKTTTILCLGIALCMLGCSDDDDQVTTISTVPFTLTASLPPVLPMQRIQASCKATGTPAASWP